ncbi:2096_t:CDS:2, partial [Funneliformis geosporum]
SKVTPKTFKDFVKNTLFIEAGIYYDRLECEDIITYQDEFLKTISYYEIYMAKYNRNNMKRIPPELKDGEKEHILIIYDECIFMLIM